MAQAYIKPRSLDRILAGHPWIYSGDIFKVEKEPEDGGEILVRSQKGFYVGTGFYNSKSRIPIRILSRSKDKLDEAFLRKRIQAAQNYREQWMKFHGGEKPVVYRLVWSEADFLPGLIIDRYEDAIVIQTLTLGMDKHKESIVRILTELFQPSLIIERNDVTSRQFEGLTSTKGILFGSGSVKRNARFGKVRCELDLIEGQKTGSYLDQIENHQLVAKHAEGKRVLDCFTYHGGFALNAAKAGASHVDAVDISADAIEICKKNAELNGLKNIHWKAANVFDELNSLQRAKKKYDLVILDPPSFTKSREKLGEAMRGYKEIHLRALQLLEPGGLLATFCCSHHVDDLSFKHVILDAGFDARKILRLRQTYGQSWDHPVIPAIPETEYLKGFLFEVV